jgi:hypothetical protein
MKNNCEPKETQEKKSIFIRQRQLQEVYARNNSPLRWLGVATMPLA